MITLSFAQRENIGFQYVLDTLRPSSPYGRERVRELRPQGRQGLLLREQGRQRRRRTPGRACRRW